MPVDMAGFALHVREIVRRPDVVFGKRASGKKTDTGHLETDFLEQFTTRDTAECRGSESEVRG